jgi:uncharacterized protein YndB with AHSA1/START domain
MNHLSVLEDGGLVATTKVGRDKYHYLNPVPIRLVHDRWITKFTEPTAAALAQLTTNLEKGAPMTTPTHIHETYIKCTPEAAWQAIVDGDQTVRYYYGTRVESDWEVGSPIRYHSPGGDIVADGEILAIDEPKSLEMTFHPHWDATLEAEGASHMAWLIDTKNGLTRVRCEYYDLATDSASYADFVEGIPFIIAGMKTVLETGQPLNVG